ncbi:MULTISPECIES: hypothetical protein [Nostocaceae]|uniref:Uncharacterized protein n=1 Tax=Anabaena cylindrica FACHB-318 TaxID=2692880 RepID=A0ABR7ZL80_ANACY|nr:MULTISPECIES: hypothetical protein [Nostocaceae]MBD2172884.1 hypothetical protein [Anabaena cylindrica FACHB-318]MBD2264491.1 hypothetical protein [Anabaena sp. FACHB-709]MBD2273813.1 hypothetical protein [Nostoc sp. PCC 7120 = FACHB-418]MBD2284905.1 hypothetical protein [Anabaena cylindrica FACHB-170]MBD2349699.1 hypothetical protein [Trichormus variabilis FACHB-171]
MCQSIIFHTAECEARSLPHRFVLRSCYLTALINHPDRPTTEINGCNPVNILDL